MNKQKCLTLAALQLACALLLIGRAPGVKLEVVGFGLLVFLCVNGVVLVYLAFNNEVDSNVTSDEPNISEAS